MSGTLEKAQIPYLPLKGAALRELYPAPWMRTSSDPDVLLHPEDLERATAALTENGWKRFAETEHDVSFKAADGTHLELHHDLVEAGRANDARQVLCTVWEHAEREGSTCRYRLDDEMFCFYHFAHMAKHLENGGCGVRPFLDLWMLEKAERLSCGALPERSGLGVFARKCCDLARVWRGEIPHDETTLRLERFLLSGGTYGNTRTNASIDTLKRGSSFRVLFHHVFLSRESLQHTYPVLKKHPLLTPFIEVVRWCKILFGRKHKIRKIRTLTGATSEDLDEVKTLLSDLDLYTPEGQ